MNTNWRMRKASAAKEFLEAYKGARGQSIDLFLARSPKYVEIGKTAIIINILNAEKESKFDEQLNPKKTIILGGVGSKSVEKSILERFPEIDIIAYKSSQVKKIKLVATLIISSKKSESDYWCFLTKEFDKKDPNIDPLPIHNSTNNKILKFKVGIKGNKNPITVIIK